MKDSITKTQIRYSMVDSGMHVTLLSLARIIEDATTLYLSEHNLSGADLNHTYGAILVVLRNHIFFHKRVHFMDTLLSKVKVVRKASVAFILKTQLFRENEEEPLITSYIQLSAIDMVTRKLRNLEEFESFKELPCDETISSKGLFFKYQPMDEHAFEEKMFTVSSTDIDYSNHMNNISYIRYFLNCLPSKTLRHLPYKEIEINYIKEAKEDHFVKVKHLLKDKEHFFLMEEGNDTLARAKMTLA